MIEFHPRPIEMLLQTYWFIWYYRLKLMQSYVTVITAIHPAFMKDYHSQRNECLNITMASKTIRTDICVERN